MGIAPHEHLERRLRSRPLTDTELSAMLLAELERTFPHPSGPEPEPFTDDELTSLLSKLDAEKPAEPGPSFD